MAKSVDIQARYQIEDDMGVVMAEFCQKLNLLMHDHSNHSVEVVVKMRRDCAPDIQTVFTRRVTARVAIDETKPKEGYAIGPATYLPVSWAGIAQTKAGLEK